MTCRLARGGAVGLVAVCAVALGGVLEVRAGVTPRPPAPLITDREVEPYGLAVGWKALAGMQQGAELTGLYPTSTEVFITDSFARLASYNAKDGTRRWGVVLDRPLNPVFEPCAVGTDVYVITGGRLIDLDRRTGLIRWETRLKRVPAAGPAVIGELVYVACADGWFLAFDRRTGEEAWYYNAQLPLVTRPVPVGVDPQVNIVICGKARLTMDFRIQCMSAADRRVIWEMPAKEVAPTEMQVTGPVVAAPARVGRNLYVPSADFNVYGIDGLTGKVLMTPAGKPWVFRSGSEVVASPVPVGPTLYFPSLRNGFYAVRLADGEKRWWRETGVRLLSVGRRRCYILDEQKAVLICDKMTGKLESRYVPPAGYEWFATNEVSDAIYLMSHDGLIVCLGEKGTGEMAAPEAAPAAAAPSTEPAPAAPPTAAP
jgi:outer membrane protein assembly factor BamB